MKIKEIWFDAEHIYGRDEEGNEYSQSLLWYPKLRMMLSRRPYNDSFLPTKKST